MPIVVDKEKKKREIIDAAIRVFSRQGYRRTKINDIAGEAGVGKGTVYEYFKSKEDLFLHMSEHLFELYILRQIENLESDRMDYLKKQKDRLKSMNGSNDEK